MKKCFAIILTVLAVHVGVYAQEKTDRQAVGVENGRFSFKDTAGTAININGNGNGLEIPACCKGKNIIIMFYIYSGTPCQNELKIFEEIRREKNDLEIITFELKGLTPQELKKYQNERDLRHLHMIDSGQALPFARYIARRAGWEGSVPLIMILGKNGELKHMQLGAMSRDELKKFCE